MQPNSFSQQSIDDLKGNFMDDSFGLFRKMGMEFYEALGFHVLELKIQDYDANDFMNFIEKLRSETVSYQERLGSNHELQSMMDELSEYLENINAMLIDGSLEKGEGLTLMTQTLEDPSNRFLRALTLFFKIAVSNLAGKKSRILYSYEEIEPFIQDDFLKTERNFSEIEYDLKLLREILSLNFVIYEGNGKNKKYNYSYFPSSKTINFLYRDQQYYILYPQTSFIGPIPLLSKEKNEAPLPVVPLDHDFSIVEANQVKSEPCEEKTNEKVVPDDPNCCCCLCKQNINEKVFINPDCGHKFCYYCLVQKTQQVSCSSYCYESRCVSKINNKLLDDYLMEMQVQKQIEDNPNAVVIRIPFTCSKCLSVEEVRVSEVYGYPEYFICPTCKDFQCCVHNLSVEICQCFCVKCKNRLEFFSKTQENYCEVCEKRACAMCRNEKKDCKCYCPVCLNKWRNKGNKCDVCEKQCLKCQIPYEKGFLVTADCGKHLFCRPCVVKDIIAVKDHKLMVCRFCNPVIKRNGKETLEF